jgi:hypothetical protein
VDFRRAPALDVENLVADILILNISLTSFFVILILNQFVIQSPLYLFPGPV